MADYITDSITVRGDVGAVYRLWADFENFPHFMESIKSVTKTGDRTSHWVMAGPLGKDLEWDARTTDIQENRRIAWSSTQGDIQASGEVTFQEVTRGSTKVTASLRYEAPAEALGEGMEKLFDDPKGMLRSDLEKFKQYAEGTHEKGMGGSMGSQGPQGSRRKPGEK